MVNPVASVQAPWLSRGARQLLLMAWRDGPLTRTQIGAATGWARATVAARLEELQLHHLLRPGGVVNGSRGRPATYYEFDPSPGRLLLADVGATGALLARCDLSGAVLGTVKMPLRIEDGPDVVLGQILPAWEALRAEDETSTWGVGVDLPGPVEHPSGRIVQPPIMTGWNGLSVPARLAEDFECPIVVENDADAMAWGEWQHAAREARLGCRGDNLLFVKVGTGVGAGIVANGALMRGADGAAGDIGHTFIDVPDRCPPPRCRCGNTGCIEAYAGGWAIMRDLNASGRNVRSVSDILQLIQTGDAEARRCVRDAGRVLGAAVASAVSLLNPAEVIIGGQLANAGEDILAGLREKIAARSLPLATQGLVIRTSRLGQRAGVVGLAAAAAEAIFQE